MLRFVLGFGESMNRWLPHEAYPRLLRTSGSASSPAASSMLSTVKPGTSGDEMGAVLEGQ